MFMRTWLKTLLTYTLLLIIMPCFLIPCFFLALLPRSIRYDNRLYFFLTSWMSRLMMWATFIDVKVTGLQHIPQYPHTPAIIIGNHMSAFDIPLLEMIIGSYPRVWMSKVGYLKVPLMAFLLRRMHVCVDKTSGKDARSALISMLGLIKNSNRHAVLFPEGTRHADGKVHDFFAGFALLAQKLNRPVVPVVITGMHKIFPKKSLLIDSSACTVTIHVGKPMYCSENMETADFVAQVQRYYQTELEKIGA